MKKCFIVGAIALLGASCTVEGAAVVATEPAGLSVTALPGGNGVLEVIALTLRKGTSNTELYAAVKNTGSVPACDAALSVELFDREEQSLAAGISGLLSQHFYRRTDGSRTIAACVSPGDVTIGAVLDLSLAVSIDEVTHVVYRCPYFALEVTPIDGLIVSRVKRVGDRYQGTLVNELDVTVSRPSVTVFPVTHDQRPLGMAIGSGDGDIEPGGNWDFETGSVEASAAEQYAYPAGALSD